MTAATGKTLGILRPAGEGFEAVIHRVGGPPDLDGDVILAGATPDGTEVAVSLFNHDSALYDKLEPAGHAVLRQEGSVVVARGTYAQNRRGRQLRALLQAGGTTQQWSVAYRVLRSRPPTEAEVAQWPGVKRIIESWAPFEISPVSLGACGPACRTVAAKATGEPCCPACEEQEALKLAALKELARAEVLRAKWLKLQMEESERAFHERWAAIAPRRPETYEINPEQVDPARRGAAWFGLKLARQALNHLDEAEHPEPIVRWFDENARLAALGFGSRGGDVWVRDGLDLPTTLETAAHEYAHYVFGPGERTAERLGQLAKMAYEQRGLNAKLLPGDTRDWHNHPGVGPGTVVVDPATLRAWWRRDWINWEEIP